MIINYTPLYSRKGFLNTLADYIEKKLNPNKDLNTKIKVTNFNNFLVVEGSTLSDIVLDLNSIKESFMKENDSLLSELNINNLNMIDIIKYSTNPVVYESYQFVYYNSKRPIYHPKVIDYVENNITNNLSSLSYNNRLTVLNDVGLSMNDTFQIFDNNSISSEFPYGYSSSFGISPLFYGEYICNHLFSYIQTDEILIKFSDNNRVNPEDTNLTIKCDSEYDEKDLESLILDLFDFNIQKFDNEVILNYDPILEMTKPFDEKPWLVKDKLKDFLIF